LQKRRFERVEQNNCSPWFWPVCRAKAGHGHCDGVCGKKSLPADLMFGYFAFKVK
jgi:hypothetical protein